MRPSNNRKARFARARFTVLPLSLIATMLLSACHHNLPREGPTIGELYAGSGVTMGESSSEAQAAVLHQRRSVQNGTADLYGYTRDSNTELRQLFPRLPNPVLVGYVFPHLGAGGNPVPGYTTAFPMYDRESFALPGEAAPTQVDPSRK